MLLTATHEFHWFRPQDAILASAAAFTSSFGPFGLMGSGYFPTWLNDANGLGEAAPPMLKPKALPTADRAPPSILPMEPRNFPSCEQSDVVRWLVRRAPATGSWLWQHTYPLLLTRS